MWTLPSICQVCGRWPSRSVCDACLQRFAPEVQRCHCCARLTPQGVQVCGVCLVRAQASPVGHCVAAVDYSYPWDGLIARFKFKGEPAWARTMARVMWQRALASQLTTQKTLWVPVPLGKARLAQRGYNQSWELCCELKRLSGHAAVAQALIRIGQAPDQHTVPLKQRRSNMVGAFVAHPAQQAHLRNAHVVLVDDVRTTGATLDNAALALRQVGCTQVDALVFAQTPSDL